MSCDIGRGIMILVRVDYKAFGAEIAAQQREDYDARTLSQAVSAATQFHQLGEIL